MRINFQGKNMALTPQMEEYALKRVTNLEKLLTKIEEKKGEEVVVRLELGKNTNHHKAGEVYHTDCLIKIDGQEFFSSADEEDLYTAIDTVKENLFREISRNKDRRQTLLHRGARSVKKMMKGLSKRKP